MAKQVLVAYATRYGSTREVAEAVAAELRTSGLDATVQPVRSVDQLDLYAAVVLGAPLMMGRWHADARRFLERHRQALGERPLAVFALGPVSDPHREGEWQSAREQLAKELARYSWLKPVAKELFGGKFDPTQFGFPMNVLAGKAPASDIRDWSAIRAWAQGLPPLLTS